MLPLLQLRDLHLPNKPVYVQALDFYVQHPISFADAFNAAFMQRHQIAEIYSWDADFDRIPGIARVEP